MLIPSWLKIWKYLQGNDPSSISQITKECDVSYSSVYFNLGILDDIGLINCTRGFKGRASKILKTQKYYNTIELFQDLYDAIDLAGRNVNVNNIPDKIPELNLDENKEEDKNGS